MFSSQPSFKYQLDSQLVHFLAFDPCYLTDYIFVFLWLTKILERFAIRICLMVVDFTLIAFILVFVNVKAGIDCTGIPIF